MPKDTQKRLDATTAECPGSSGGCDLCGEGDFETVAHRDRRGRQLGTVVCRNCGLVSHACIPTDEELAAYYQREYRQEYHSEFTPSASRVLREWTRGGWTFEMLKDYVRPSQRVFEVGCGIGCKLKHFNLAGFDVAGVEPGDGFRRFAREKLHLRVAGGMLADVPRQPEYDFVLLLHVLEHLNSPAAALRHIRSILNPGGRLYVEVPNLNAPHASPGKLFHFAHIYNFTPTTLSTLARACGFEVETLLSEPRDKNLMMMLSVTDRCAVEVPANSYSSTMAAIRRFNSITYHLRWQYLRERFTSVRLLRGGNSDTEQRVSEILEMCEAHASRHRTVLAVKKYSMAG